MSGQKIKTIYLIPGLAATGRIFSGISLPGYKIKILEWEEPVPGESISDYALRFSRHIDDSEPFAFIRLIIWRHYVNRNK